MRCRAFFLSKLDRALLIRAVARLRASRPRFAITCLCRHITDQHLAMPPTRQFFSSPAQCVAMLYSASAVTPRNKTYHCLALAVLLPAMPLPFYALLCHRDSRLCLAATKRCFALTLRCFALPMHLCAMPSRSITKLCPHEAFTSVISVKQRPLPDDLH